MSSPTPLWPAFIEQENLLSVVLVQPRIPPNVGAISRTCAATGCPFFIVGPVAFREDHPKRKRAGLDYWDLAEKYWIADWTDMNRHHPVEKFWFFSKKAHRSLYDVTFSRGDYLVFGSEPEGLPEEILEAHPDRLVRIPMRPGIRSLNLATSVGVALYEGLRQLRFGELPNRTSQQDTP